MTYFSLPLLLLVSVVNIKVQSMIESSSWPQPLVSMVPVTKCRWWSGGAGAGTGSGLHSSSFLHPPPPQPGVPARPARYTARPGQPGQLESGARAADPFQGSKTLELFWYHLPFPAVK